MAPADSATPTVALVGDDGLTHHVEAAVGPPVAVGVDAALAADPDVIVAAGEAAAVRVAGERPDAPVLPVAAGAGLGSVPPATLEQALERYGSDTWRTESHPLVSVAVGDDRRGRALLDVSLVGAEPARISEFTITTAGDPVDGVRADGVVAATPAGSLGYGRAVGMPTVAPGLDVLAVAPIAPFTTDPSTWVLPDDELTVTVERDDAQIAVLADDRPVAEAQAGTPVTISRDGSVRTVVVPEGASPLGAEDAELEKH